MSKLSKFAGLLKMGSGAQAPAATKAADGEDTDMEKPTKRDDESEEEFQKRLKEWEDAQDDGESAEEPKDTSDDDQTKEEKLKKAKADGVAEGVAAEKARWSAVLSAPEASGRVVAACTFLDGTNLEAPAITKALAAMPAERSARSTLADRQAGEVIPVPATGGTVDNAGNPAKSFADGVAAAVAKARPVKAA